jgi:hypothetical protein
MTANLRKYLADDEIHTIAARVEQPEDGSPHFYVNDENNVIIHARTLHHDIPVEANWSMPPGQWSVPEIGTEVLLASDFGKFEGELYVTGHYSSTKTQIPLNLSPQSYHVVVTGDAEVVVGAGSKIKLRSSDVTEKTMKGETYRSAEDVLLTALNTMLIALNAYAVAIQGIADPTSVATPVLSTAIGVMETAIATFKGSGTTYLTTVVEVE